MQGDTRKTKTRPFVSGRKDAVPPDFVTVWEKMLFGCVRHALAGRITVPCRRALLRACPVHARILPDDFIRAPRRTFTNRPFSVDRLRITASVHSNQDYSTFLLICQGFSQFFCKMGDTVCYSSGSTRLPFWLCLLFLWYTCIFYPHPPDPLPLPGKGENS